MWCFGGCANRCAHLQLGPLVRGPTLLCAVPHADGQKSGWCRLVVQCEQEVINRIALCRLMRDNEQSREPIRRGSHRIGAGFPGRQGETLHLGLARKCRGGGEFPHRVVSPVDVGKSDADTPRLNRNLTKVFASLRRDAIKRVAPSVATAKVWQKQTMAGLTVPNAVYVGRFRGERGLKNCQVRIGSAFGVAPAGVAAELHAFEVRLRNIVAALDNSYPTTTSPPGARKQSRNRQAPGISTVHARREATLTPNVLVPELWPTHDEIGHQANALRIL